IGLTRLRAINPQVAYTSARCYTPVKPRVTGDQLIEREQHLAEIDKLVNSHALHGSEQLCKLLRYLAKHALDHHGIPIKEYQIATEVFGRSADFDPQLDSMVRVQAGRLRVKLAEYYNSDGAEDPIVVELPRGTYVLSFHRRAPGQTKPHQGNGTDAHWDSLPRGHAVRNWIIATVSLGVLLAASTL